MKIEKDIFAAVAILGVLLWIGNASLWGNELQHSFPYGMGASDAFQHQSRAESIKDMGNYRHEAPHIVHGFTDVVGYYPPVLYHLAVLLSHASGLETYDTAFFMVFFLAIMAAMATYFLLRQFNESAALLATPLFVFLFVNPLTAAYTWGQWPAAASHVFVIAAVWALVIKSRGWWAFTGVFSAAAMLTHTAGMVFLAAFFAFYGAWLLWKKKSAELKELVKAGIVAAALSLYYIIIFQGTWARVQKYTFFKVEHTTQSFPTIMPSHFAWTAIAIGAGIVLALLIKKNRVPLWFGGWMALAGLTNYIGFAFRAFQIRFFWPVYLAGFFGWALYQPLRFIAKRQRNIIAIVAAAAITGMLISTNTTMTQSQGALDQARWDALQWIRHNTPANATAYFLYGDLWQQTSLLYNSHRVSRIVKVNDFAAYLANGTMTRNYKADTASDSGAGFPYRTGLLSFGYHVQDVQWGGTADMCSADYIVLDKVTGYQQLSPVVQYNIFVAQKLISNGAEEAYSNQYVSIIKNNNASGECIG